MTDGRARYSPLAMSVFEAGFLPWRRRRLRTLLSLPPRASVPAGMPLVLVANHVSWWDGFLLRDVHRALRPRSPLFTFMSEAGARQHPFLRRIGAVPLAPRSDSVRAALRAVADERTTQPDLCVAWFPQGRIAPSWHRPLRFQRGVETLLARLDPCVVLPLALHIEPLRDAAPTAFVHAGPLLCAGPQITAAYLECAVSRALNELLSNIAVHGEDVAERVYGA